MRNKTMYTLAMVYLATGCAVFSLSSIFRQYLSDFALGFCEGISVALILGSAIYLVKYFIRKKKSF